MPRLGAPVLALALTAASVLAYFGFLAQRSARPSKVSDSAQLGPSPALRSASGAASPEPPAAVAARARPGEADERRALAELRELRARDPERALLRAAELEAQYPGSPHAAERAYQVVRSLEDLRRFHAARAAAEVMKERYPGTPWTEDVERHVLLHPLDLPSREEQQAGFPANSPD